MKLGKWLDENGVTQTKFGDMIGSRPDRVSRWVSGECYPNKPEIFRAIYEATNGDVTPNDFFNIAI